MGAGDGTRSFSDGGCTVAELDLCRRKILQPDQEDSPGGLRGGLSRTIATPEVLRGGEMRGKEVIGHPHLAQKLDCRETGGIPTGLDHEVQEEHSIGEDRREIEQIAKSEETGH